VIHERTYNLFITLRNLRLWGGMVQIFYDPDNGESFYLIMDGK